MSGGAGTAFQEGSVRGFLDRPEGALEDGLVITHGAGGDSRMAPAVTERSSPDAVCSTTP